MSRYIYATNPVGFSDPVLAGAYLAIFHQFAAAGYTATLRKRVEMIATCQHETTITFNTSIDIGLHQQILHEARLLLDGVRIPPRK